jgi:hypothetical protein
MKHSVRFRALLASALVIGVLAVVPSPAAAQTSDVALTIDPTYQIFPALNPGDVPTLPAFGEVSCSSTTVDGDELLSARIQQSGREVLRDPLFGFALCDPSMPGLGFWSTFFDAGQLRPGQATLTVELTLDDGTIVSATRTVRIVNANKPSKQTFEVDFVHPDFELSEFCGFPVEAHDVGREQIFFFTPKLVSAEKFVGTTTYTNVDTGTSVVVGAAPRVKIFGFEEKAVFTGLNYRIRTSDGQLVSSGRGVLTPAGETATPHLTHLTEVICGLLAAP